MWSYYEIRLEIHATRAYILVGQMDSDTCKSM